jgi:hypothetical protein
MATADPILVLLAGFAFFAMTSAVVISCVVCRWSGARRTPVRHVVKPSFVLPGWRESVRPTSTVSGRTAARTARAFAEPVSEWQASRVRIETNWA